MSLRRDSFFLDGVDSHKYNLPHPPIAFPIILVVRNAVIQVLDALRAQKTIDLGQLKEDEITVALHAGLEEQRRNGNIQGFDTNTFERISRQHQADNYSGTTLKKEPDMLFPLRDDLRKNIIPSKDGLVVECKPIDKKHPANEHYCNKGIQRFVNGEYAWAMQESLMLGYSRDGRSIPTHLLPVMKKDENLRKLRTIQQPIKLLSSVCPRSDDLYISQHERNFQWREKKGKATPINIYHSWHLCE